MGEAYNLLVDKSVNYGGVYGGNLAFTRDEGKIKQAVRDLGFGLADIADGVEDCHLEEFLQIIEALAAKLGMAPEIQIVETMVKILIEGREIEAEVADVCSDYATDNWPALGYDLIKLSKHCCRSRKCRAKYLFRFRNSCCSADSFVHGAKSTVTVCIWCWTDRDVSGADGTEVALLLHIQCMHVSAHVTADFSELFRGCLP